MPGATARRAASPRQRGRVDGARWRVRRTSPSVLVVAAVILAAAGQAWLAPAAGARMPTGAGLPSTAAFVPLRLPGAVSEPGIGAATDIGRTEAIRTRQDPARGAASVGNDVDRWGLALTTSRPAGSVAAPGPLAAVPEVVRFRPRDGWTGVVPGADLSVRFTTAMDRPTTELAFRASIGGTPIAGSIRWAEGDTVLVFRPRAALPYGSVVELQVDVGAASVTGTSLLRAASATFTVAPRPAARPQSPVAAVGSSSSGWRWPLLGPITQYFGQTLTQYGPHQGIDIDGDTGDPVRAAHAGIVVVAGYADECGGLQVRIDVGGGLLTWYRHLSQISTSVGARVDAGAVIGQVGATGCATGSHLHFGISRNGVYVDPLRYLPPR